MNEQAIQDSYNLFVQQGYKKSIDDFKQLISTNPDALNDSFDLFQKEGYNKSIEDYKNLMGVGAQPTLKKKEPTTTESSLAGTSSGLSSEQNLNPFAKNTVGIPQPEPTKTVAPQQAIKPMAEATSVPAIDVTEKAPMVPAIDVETQKLITDEKNISTIAEDDDWYSDKLKTVSFLADKIQYLNPTAAAVFPATTKGAVKFLDNTFRAIDQGQRQGSIVAPATTMEALGKNTSSETIQKYIRATKDVERFGPSKDMQAFSKTYQDEGESTFGVIKGLVENPQVLPELVISSMSTMANLSTVAAGAAVVGGAATAGFVGGAGVGAIPAALASMPYAMGTMSAVLENGLTFGELLQEELTKRNLPFTEEGVRKVLEDEKALSSIRIRSISRGAIIGVIDGLTARVAGKVGAKLLGNTAASKIKAGGAAVGIEMVGGSGGEASARAAIGQKMDKAEIILEGISEGPMAIPSLYTEVLKRPTFKINGEAVTEQTVKDIVENANGAELATIKFEIKNDNVGYNKIIQDKVVTNSIKEDVRKANPNLNETSLNAITELEKQLQDLEGNKTQTGKDKSAALRQEIKNIQENQLQEEVKAEVVIEEKPKEYIYYEKDGKYFKKLGQDGEEQGITKTTYNFETKKIAEKAALETTKPKEDAIQEPSTDESLLRGKQPKVGLPKMGEGNVQPKGTTTGTTEVVNAQPKKEVDDRPIAERQAEAESKIKLTDVFEGAGEYSKLGGSDRAAVPVSHSENNGIEILEYAHPKTGSIDLVVTAKSDNDFVSFYRIYENGKATNKWSSKFENQSRNKEDFKTMISSVQSLLPEGHEYTETTSISTDGLRVWNQQLNRGYELQYDKNGNLITEKVAINGDAIVNNLDIEVNKGNFDNIKVKSEEEFQKVKERLLPYLNKIGLNEENVYFTEGTVKIDLPVLKKQSPVTTEGTTEVTPAQPQEEVKAKTELFFDDADVIFPNDDIRGGYAVTNEDGKQIGRVKMSKVDDNIVKIDEVVSEQRGERTGNGSAIMKMVTDNADKNNVTLTLTPNLIGDLKAKGFETPKQLQNFYEKFGFVKDSGRATMTRNPISQPTTEVSSKTPEQEVTELKGLFGKKEATTDSGISVSDKTTVNNIKTKLADKAKTKIIESAQRGLTTLRSVLPNFDIVIHENEGSYNAAMEKLGATQGSKGNFQAYETADGGYSGRIDINLDRADGRTVAHEIFHGVMLKAFGENPKLFKAFKDRISKVLKDSTNKQLIEFANLYEGDVTYEEYLAELGGILEQQEETISPSTLQKIAAIINEFVAKITNGALKPFEDIKNTKDIVDFFNTISESIRKGEEITITEKSNVVKKAQASKSQVDNRSKAIAVANTMGMNDKGFFKRDSNPSQLNNMLRQYGYGVKQAKVTPDGFGGGYYLVDEQGRKAIKTPISKAQKINLRDYKTKEVKGEELKVGDIYVRDIFGERFVYKLLEIPKVDWVKGNFFNADVEILHIGTWNNENAKKYGIREKNIGDKTLDRFKSPRANLRKFGKLKLIENWDEVNSTPISKAQLPMVFEPKDGLPYKSEVKGNYPIENKNVKEGDVKTLEEVWSQVKDIKFSGDTKIKSHADVAFVMKTLESKGVEHAFAVHIDEKGTAHIQFLGIGGVTAAQVDARIVTTGAKRYKAKKTYLIHNHPSGNLKPSGADFRLTERIQEGFKGLGIELEHIIIDTYKEQYTVLKQGDTFESFQRAKEATGKEKPYKVEKMDSNKVLSKPIGRVFSADDVVEKIQQMRFSALPKKGIFILNSANDIIANIMVDNFEFKTIVDAMIDTPTAVSIIAYGNSDTATEKSIIKDLRNELALLEVRLLDFVQTSSNTEGIIDYYKSWESEGFLEEVQSKYETNSVVVSKAQKVQQEVEQMQQSIPVPISKAQKGLINLTENDVLKYKRVGIDDKRTAQAMNQIGLSGVKFTKEEVDKKITEEFNKLIKDADNYIINEDSPAITQAIKAEITTLEDEGASLSRIESAKSALDENSPMRANFISQYAKAQEETLSQWKSYLNQSDYSDAFKYIILDAVLTNNYDLKTGAYTKRSNKTIRNFTPFDAGTLASIYDSESKALLKDYVEVQSNNINNIVGANSMVSTKEGKWLKFDGGENAKDITGTANKLSQLVQNTYWCTKTNALSQLRGGDFYVYVTDDKNGEYVPRIAVRMEGDKVGEVRGNASSKQDLEPDMLPVADKFLKESIPNDSGKKWLDAIAYNNKVKDFTKKIENNSISKNDILEYLDIIKDAKKYSVDYGENGLVSILKETFDKKIEQDNFTEDLKGKVAKNSININENTEIFFGSLSASFDDLSKVKNLKLITGYLDFEESEIKSLGNLEVIGGDANFKNSDLEDLGNLKSIGGNVDFRNSNIKNLDNLEFIGGNAGFENSRVKDLGKLKTIGASADFEGSIIEDLGNLETIGKRGYFRNSKVENLGNLKTIGGGADFGYSNIENLNNLEFIGGNAEFVNSRVKELGNLKRIVYNADFADSNIKSLGNLETIGRNANFFNSKVENLGNLKTIGGDADFGYSNIENLNNLKSIVGSADFGYSNVKSLGNLETIGGSGEFINSNVEDLGNLKTIGGSADFRKSKIKNLGNLESVGEELYIVNSEIKDLGKLKFIGGPLYSDNPVLNAQALDIKEKQSPISKAQLTDSTTKVVKEARAQGFSEEAIKLFLEGEGIPAAEIKSAMAPETPASARVKISEKLSVGFDRMMGEVEGIIEKSKKRNVDQAKITENVISYVMGSKVYENATDVQREKIIRDIKTKFGINLKSAPSVAKLFGTLKDVKKFTLTEKQLYIKRLKDLQEGAKTAVAATKKAAILMAQEIKALVKSGNITARQGGFIISKFAKVNMLSPTSVSRFVDYMGKVFADAEYGAQLKTASGLKADIKKLSKNKDKNADFRKLAEEFINIDPSMVEDIYAYNEMASQIKSSVKGSTLRGEKVKFSDVVSIQDATRYISDTLRVQDKKILEEQRAEIQELMDIDASDMTPEQLRILLEGEGEAKVTKYNESIVRSLLDKAFKAYSGVINEILKTNYDAFYTGEKVELTKNQKTLIKQFMDMDLSILTPKESLQAVDALANFIQNQSTAKMQTVVSDYTGRLNARKLAKSGIKAQPLMKYFSKGFGRFLAEQTTTLPILFEKMFKGFNRSGEVQDMMGVTNLINGKSNAQTKSNIIVNNYVKQFFNKKANGEAFNTEYNNVERNMSSFMMRNVIGTEQEMKSEFNRRKNLLEESIEVLSKGNDVEKQKGKLYQKAYDKILADTNNIQEIKNKTDKTNLEAIDFWMNEWANIYQELSDVSENIYNKILEKDINYSSPDRFAKISSDTGEVDLANDESAFHNNNGTIYKKETGVLMKATKPETLPTNKKNGKPTSYIELSFDKNNSNAMYDALVDIKTAAPIRQIEAFENSEDFEKIVPTADDAKILKDRIQLYIRNIRNKNPYTDDQFSKAVRRLNRLAAFGVGQALGGVTQPIKQTVSVGTNTLINAGSLDVMGAFDAAKQKFISESGYGIANRGVESQAQIESLNKLIDIASKGNFDKTIKTIEKVNQEYLELFLVNPDVFIARASWMTYYEKSLKEQGVDTKGIDYNTHELNEKAANYAQRMVDRQQNISDVDLSGKLFASKESANQVLVKMLMPFASFRMNQSARLGADLATLSDKTATAEDKKIAAKSVAGFGVELATFKMISAGIAITLGTLTKMGMGEDEDEEEKDKRMNDIIKGQWTGTITDIISPLPIVDKPIQAAVETVSTLLEEGTGLPVSTFGVRKSDWTSNLGTFGISAQRATELYDMTKLAATGEYTDDFNKKHTISSERQEQITYLLPFAMLSNMGLAPSEVNTVVKNAVKYAKKNTKSTAEKAQAKENKEERESNKQEKINALKSIIEESNDEAIIKQAREKIDEVDADSEEKKAIKQENAQEKQAKKKLLVDPDTGEEYDSESDLKRYNKDLWEQNFGEGSDWYESHKEEKEVESLLRKKVQQMKDEKMNYTGRNSDGSVKRFGASGTKKTQRFGASGKGKTKRFGS